MPRPRSFVEAALGPGEAWSLRGRNSRLPQDRRSGLARASAARRARRAAHRMCAVQFALISTICPSFSLNMTRTSKQELKMHAQAKPERPKGEGHGWPEFYSPQMRGKWWSDIEFSLSRLSTAQTPCLAPTILHGTFRSMEQMQISEFRAKCLAVLARVGRTGNPVLITRFGKPVARIVPAARVDRDAWLGSLRGSGKILDDLVEPVSSPDEWEVLPS